MWLWVPACHQAPFINYIVCLAVRQGIMDALEPLLQGAPPPPVRIKWPNDIYAHGLKIGGALIHTTWQTDRFNVVTGVGLNVNNRTPTTCLDILLAQALAAHRGQPAPADVADVAAWPADHVVSREAVLAGVLNRLEEYYNVSQGEELTVCNDY